MHLELALDTTDTNGARRAPMRRGTLSHSNKSTFYTNNVINKVYTSVPTPAFMAICVYCKSNLTQTKQKDSCAFPKTARAANMSRSFVANQTIPYTLFAII